MKSAEEILIEHHTQPHNDKMFSQHNWNLPDIIEAMKEYARQAVEVALKDAAENVYNEIYAPNGYTNTGKKAQETILNSKEEIFKKLGI